MSFGLASPLWLVGLSALLLPLVLHLLARGRGRRVRVGSVRFLTAAPPRRPSRLQLQRPLLLALRCLLLALVVLALTAPRLSRASAAAAPPVWVLVEPGIGASELPARAGTAIAAGAELRSLAPGLPRRAAGGGGATPEGGGELAALPGGTWSLLREAAASAPAGTRLVVVSRGRLAALRGERPALSNPVDWLSVPPPGDRGTAMTNRWPVRAAATPAGRTLVVGESDASVTTFRREPLAAEARTARVPPGDAFAADDSLPLPTAAALRVAVLTAPARAAEARYVRAALAVAAEAAGVAIVVTPATGSGHAVALPAVAGTTERPALAFWLSDAPPPAQLLAAVREGTVLVTEASGSEESCAGGFSAAVNAVPVMLHRCAAAAGTRGRAAAVPTWRSDRGRVVLAAESLGRGRWLRFASRFHPAWSDLVLSGAFPEWLRDLLRETAGASAGAERSGSDQRGDGGQGAPARAVARGGSATAPPTPSRAPEQLAWLLLFPLLVAERWLAVRR